MNKLSVVVCCYNNQEVIGDCLESVKWADEIIVCDSFSSDRTLDIARQYSLRIFQRTYVNASEQKNWAVSQASKDWILVVDSDERISPELKEEILQAINSSFDHSAFRIPRSNISFGKKMRYGGYWPDWQERLFRAGKAAYDSREVHERLVVEGKMGKLKNPIIHFPDRDLRQTAEKMFCLYAKLEAKERLKKEKAGVFKLVFDPPKIFFYRYFLRGGFLDGWRGFLAAVLWSGYAFMARAYMWEEKNKDKASAGIEK